MKRLYLLRQRSSLNVDQVLCCILICIQIILQAQVLVFKPGIAVPNSGVGSNEDGGF